MIRAILDANVYVSAAIGRSSESPALQLVRAATDGRIEALICPTLMRELGRTLGYKRMRRYLTIDEGVAFVADLPAFTVVVPDPPEPYPALCRDPKDDYLLALASATQTELIVTGDRDLLELESSPVAVITPRAALERLERDA